jgi:hypothetical protein
MDSVLIVEVYMAISASDFEDKHVSYWLILSILEGKKYLRKDLSIQGLCHKKKGKRLPLVIRGIKFYLCLYTHPSVPHLVSSQ